MSNKVNRKVELHRIEILNNNDNNDMYAKKIILEDLLVDFLIHQNMTKKVKSVLK